SMTVFPLLAAPMGVIPTPLSFVPEPVPLVAHGIFFAVGWVLFRHVDLLPALGRHARRDITLALSLLPLSSLALRFRSLVTPPGSFGPLPPGAETSLAVGSVSDIGLTQSWAWPMGLLALPGPFPPDDLDTNPAGTTTGSGPDQAGAGSGHHDESDAARV